MKNLLSALALAALATPALANTGPIFLPDLTFPQPVTQPDVSTQGCVKPLDDAGAASCN